VDNHFCIQTRIITACLLLEKLNLNEMVDELIENHEAMRILALNKSELLKDFELTQH